MPKAFTEKGLYMLATILKSEVATSATLTIIETFAKIKELSININAIMKTTDELVQQDLANKSNSILEEIIDIDEEILKDDEDGEIIETTTKFEFNLGFAKVSRSVKKLKNSIKILVTGTAEFIGHALAKEAQQKSLVNGIANVYSKNQRIYFQLPDGTITENIPKEYIEQKTA